MLKFLSPDSPKYVCGPKYNERPLSFHLCFILDLWSEAHVNQEFSSLVLSTRDLERTTSRKSPFRGMTWPFMSDENRGPGTNLVLIWGQGSFWLCNWPVTRWSIKRSTELSRPRLYSVPQSRPLFQQSLVSEIVDICHRTSVLLV